MASSACAQQLRHLAGLGSARAVSHGTRCRALSSVVQQVALEAASRPERQIVARIEGLSDHGHLAARHPVEHGSPVGAGQAQIWEGVDRHGGPAVRPHRQRHGCRRRGARRRCGSRRRRGPRDPTRRTGPTPGSRSRCRRAAGRANARGCDGRGRSVERVAEGGVEVDGRGRARRRSSLATPGQATSSGMWPISGCTGTAGLPQMPRSPR